MPPMFQKQKQALVPILHCKHCHTPFQYDRQPSFMFHIRRVSRTGQRLQVSAQGAQWSWSKLSSFNRPPFPKQDVRTAQHLLLYSDVWELWFVMAYYKGDKMFGCVYLPQGSSHSSLVLRKASKFFCDPINQQRKVGPFNCCLRCSAPRFEFQPLKQCNVGIYLNPTYKCRNLQGFKIFTNQVTKNKLYEENTKKKNYDF